MQTERDRFEAEHEQLAAELASMHAELGEYAPSDVRPLADERATLAAEVEQSRGEVEPIQGDLLRLQGELEARTVEEAGRERETAERQQRWEADLQAARSEAERLAALVRDREAELAAAIEARDRASNERESVKVEARRLRLALDQYEREQYDRGEEDQAEIDRFRAQFDLLRAENERVRTDLDRLRAENEQLRAQPVRNGAPVSSSDRDEQLRTVTAQVESLQRELAESRRLQSQMSAMLGGIGIRFREI
jgi:chromosome segregation ATPase